MKKLLLPAMFMLAAALGNAQSINVSTTSHTVPQLVNDVLINSPCVEATNVTWRTGSNYGSSNGIGYFTNTNPGFPMQSGVILSTGSAMNAVGPNTTMLNDGSPSWPGDAQLEATLAAAGISMNSVNATVLEFDFTPISSHFNFDFVFASEEYGNFQCQFSDAFAFLLTNMNTGVTTNLAVVPSTNTPISVVTIRDFLYNSSCTSANPQYFGSFNGGSAAAGSATNFNGQTVLLNASSVLTPNTPYHIKLVIADRSDYESDSAIFINSDSFNIGQDVLGLDLTVANGTAVCFGESYTLTTGLDPAQYTFSWTRNNQPIASATGPSIVVTQAGNYSVTYTNIIDTCQPVTDEISIEYYPRITTGAPVNLYKCDLGAATYTYDLSFNTPKLIVGMNPATQVTYFASQADAENNVNPLPLNYTAAPGTTIYARVQHHLTNCYVIRTFDLLTSPAPVAAALPDVTKCARSLTQVKAFVVFNQYVAAVLNGQPTSTHTVRFFLSQADADNGTNQLGGSQYLASNGTVVYVRVQNTQDPDCYSTTSFTFYVNPLPPVDQLEDVIVCNNYVLPALTNGNYFTENNGTGTPLFAGDVIEETSTIYIFNQPEGPEGCASNSNFKVTIVNPDEMSPSGGTYCGSYTVTAPERGEYRTEPNGGGTVIPPGTVITESQTLHFYFITEEEPFCVVDTDVEVEILPMTSVPALPNVFDCVSYTLPPLAVGNYYTEPNGEGIQLNAGDVITTTQTIYIRATGGTAEHPCVDERQFTVSIGMNMPPDVAQCQPYTLPALASGNYYTGPGGTGDVIPAGTVISQSQMVYIYIPNSSACVGDLHFYVSIAQPPVDSLQDVSVCEMYTLPALVHGEYYTGPNKSGTQLFPGDSIYETQTVYIYAEIAGGCSNESDFVVTINPLPAIDSRSDIDICHSYTLTALEDGNYYTGPNGTGTLLPAGTVITTSQRIYIYAVNNGTPACAAENSFEINIFSIEADQPANVVACDSYVLPALTNGNYYPNPGGPTQNTTMMHAGDVITSSTTLYIYVESGERINCSDENSFTITINQTPVVAAIPTQNACNAYTLPTLALGNYYTGPGKTGTMLNAGDVLTTSQTVYVYAETGTTPNCFDEKSFQVNVFNVDELADVTTCDRFVLPALTVGGYYTGPNGTGTHLAAGSAVTSSQTIYIYAVAPFSPTCSDESSFTVTIVDAPTAHSVPAAQTTVCDEDGNNDGIVTFDLTLLDATVLGSQTGAEFTIAYYATLQDANNAVSAITSTTAATIYVRVSNTLAPSCFDVRTITIRVNKLPEPTPQDGVICFDTRTQTLINPYTITSGLNASQHTFQWRNEAGTIVGTGANYVATTPGVYTVTATRIATGCVSEPVSVTVSPSEPAIVAYTVNEDFADNQSITVIASGTGDYEYMIDNNGIWQDSPVFDNVNSGLHIITVRDRNGCGSTTETALVVNYPKYFTPNGDGIHDTWNITDLKLDGQGNSKINIYDRYGKFLTQIKPAGNGWDGTYNGAPMPSTDYWFTVEYVEDGVAKEFKAHFAMKR